MSQLFAFSRRNSRKGSVLIMGTLTMTVLFGFMGLALDMSYMYFHKRRMQTAADAGAIAGAQEILRGNANSAIVASAKNDTALDGFTDTASGVTVTVNNPPVNGPSAGNAGFVEVIVSQAQPTWFMRVVGADTATVRARAVAGLGAGQACVYTLNPNLGNNNGFFINGNATASFACGIYSNSNFRAVGGGCVTAPSISYVGTNSNGSGCTPNVSQGIQVVDPLLNKYTMPTPATPCDAAHTNVKFTGDPAGSTTRTLTPGTYCGGIDIGGSSTNVVFSQGTYILLGGGLSLTSSVSVTGTGVTFFNTFDASHSYGQVKITGSGLINLSAPTT
ncbi:MAG: pilus assembly protein TadG-related protein, partial [Bryobacteraceae bacterium]